MFPIAHKLCGPPLRSRRVKTEFGQVRAAQTQIRSLLALASEGTSSTRGVSDVMR